MKALIVYYSRTGVTKKIAEKMAKLLKSDIEEIKDTKDRSGIVGYMKGGHDAGLKKLTTIEKTKKSPEKYDIIIIGTPVWAWAMAPSIRTYIEQKKTRFSCIALFCTMGNSARNTLNEMETIIGKKALAKIELKAADIQKEKYHEEINNFVNVIKNFKEKN